MVSAAVCFSYGTEMAYRLLAQMKTVGVFHTPAKFIPAWKSASEVAPSPKYTAVTVLSPLSLVM